MCRYIDADRLKETLANYHPFATKQDLTFNKIIRLINEEPTADTIGGIKGEWIFKEVMIRSPLAENYYCSTCKISTTRYWNFCPNCGADMREVRK